MSKFGSSTQTGGPRLNGTLRSFLRYSGTSGRRRAIAATNSSYGGAGPSKTAIDPIANEVSWSWSSASIKAASSDFSRSMPAPYSSGPVIPTDLRDPGGSHLADGLLQGAVDVLRIDVEFLSGLLLGPRDGLANCLLDLALADYDESSFAWVDVVAQFLSFRPRHPLCQVPADAADHAAGRRRTEDCRREQDADGRPGGDSPPGAVAGGCLVLVLMDLAGCVLGYDGRVVGADQASFARVLHDLVVVPRHCLVWIRRHQYECAARTGHICLPPYRWRHRQPRWRPSAATASSSRLSACPLPRRHPCRARRRRPDRRGWCREIGACRERVGSGQAGGGTR